MRQTEPLLQQFGEQVQEVEHEVLNAVDRFQLLKRQQPPVRNVNQEFQDSFSPMERVALFITVRVGSFGFFLTIVAWTILWLTWNLVGPVNLRFDPAPAFVFWLFISNMIQISLMPLIMVGQNLLSRHAEFRAQSEYEINLKAEKAIEVILVHLQEQAAHLERQSELILQILKRLGQPAGTAPIALGTDTQQPAPGVKR